MQILLIIFTLSTIVVSNIKAQDAGFTQFYANPLYLNPALAGSGECNRFIVNYRNQWPSVLKGFTTYGASADFRIDKLSGGIGIMAYADNAGGMLNTYRISGIYSYHLKLNNNTNLNAGFEVDLHRQQLNWDDLLFSDMIDYSTGLVFSSSTSQPKIDNASATVADFSSGLVMDIKQIFFVGIAAHHMTQPAIDFYTNSSDNLLYIKYTAHAGARIKLKDSYFETEKGKLYLSPNILFQQQKNARQLNSGFNIDYYPFTIGTWYRYNVNNSDAFVILFGLKQKRFKFGYSYDTSLSALKGVSGGAHEVSIELLIMCSGKRNRPGAIKCPEF
ncbi:MAG: PorP/SprF family type IX secretion system membrane protein [Bacteroidales bacterium]|nr:PorP/SprF family type IX secretion system membrane protein [Bacteroidales bacterium]MCF8404248.1 PorP/SprF family type IX secretion system membrane protein [Bacteroidales bacterium]